MYLYPTRLFPPCRSLVRLDRGRQCAHSPGIRRRAPASASLRPRRAAAASFARMEELNSVSVQFEIEPVAVAQHFHRLRVDAAELTVRWSAVLMRDRRGKAPAKLAAKEPGRSLKLLADANEIEGG